MYAAISNKVSAQKDKEREREWRGGMLKGPRSPRAPDNHASRISLSATNSLPFIKENRYLRAWAIDDGY